MYDISSSIRMQYIFNLWSVELTFIYISAISKSVMNGDAPGIIAKIEAALNESSTAKEILDK